MRVYREGFGVFLEPLSLEDADALSRNASDYEIAYSAASFGAFPYPYTIEHAQSFIESAQSSMDYGRAYHFGIRTLDGTLIGAAGALEIDPAGKSCGIGYWLGKEHWGKGYAKEAVALLSSFCFEKLGADCINADVFSFNERSISLLKGLGFSRDVRFSNLVAHYDGYVEEQRYTMRKAHE